MTLQGKVALVTGGAQGIGRAIAMRLAQEGATVLIEDLSDNARAEETLQELQAMGARTALLVGDVGKVADGQRVIREGVAAMGRIDILVNNAGVERRAGFLDASEADYDLVMHVNLKGPFFITQAFAGTCANAVATAG